jgi:hypothetical protein
MLHEAIWALEKCGAAATPPTRRQRIAFRDNALWPELRPFIGAEMRLNVAVYSPCWNEETILPFYLSHYAKFARTINLFDNQSSDRSPEIIAEFQRQHRDVKIKFGALDTDGQLRDDIQIRLKNETWKECRGKGVDWVVVCDMDEFIYHRNISAKLRDLRRQHYTAILCTGYDMIAPDFPKANQPADLTALVRRGRFTKRYSKCAIFDPAKLSKLPICRARMHASLRGMCESFTTRA